MSFLRVGTACAVFDDDGRVLLSKRGDLNVWNLPTGRLDSGEVLYEAAAREAREETGVVVQIERPVGLYYFAATRRLNVLYEAFPVGGELVQQTDETRANQYFVPKEMPVGVFGGYMAVHAATPTRKVLYVHETPPDEIRRVRRKLARRWVTNLLRGKPEPRHVRFHVQAVGLLFDTAHRRLLTLPGHRERVLPFVACMGDDAPWLELVSGVQAAFGLTPHFHWVGVWQDVSRDAIELVFAATVPESTLPPGAEWSTAQTAALLDRDAAYIDRVKASYPIDPVWTITEPVDELPSMVAGR